MSFLKILAHSSPTLCPSSSTSAAPVEPFIEISSTQGVTARFLPYGATITSLFVKDRDSNPVDVVLGFDDVKGYKQDTAYVGRTIGRVCNRIGNARFTFEGKQYELPVNNPPHHLHSGPEGIALKEWEVARHTPTSVTFRKRTNEEEDGLPGDAKIDVTYTVNDRNQLVIEHGATCHSPGVLNLTNHSYWNLDGSQSVRDHLLYIGADRYLPTDSNDFPTGSFLDSIEFRQRCLGEIASVQGTKFDFNEEKPLTSLCDASGNIDIDDDMVLCEDRQSRYLSLFSPVSGIRMKVTTSYPVIHLYGAKHLKCKGKQGEEYGSGKGLAIEAQFHTA
ncbi:putative aldose 1-epimerase, partial [Ancylostoma caninum]